MSKVTTIERLDTLALWLRHNAAKRQGYQGPNKTGAWWSFHHTIDRMLRKYEDRLTPEDRALVLEWAYTGMVPRGAEVRR